MSQTVLEEKPERTIPMFAVPERTVMARARKRRAPEGIGEQRIPMIVATNIANMCQAFGERPSGHGRSQIPTRRMRGIAQRNVGTFFHHMVDLLGILGVGGFAGLPDADRVICSNAGLGLIYRSVHTFGTGPSL